MPLNSNYLLLGIDTSIFILNSGSFFIMMAIIVVAFIAKLAYNSLAFMLARFRPYRLLGIWIGSDNNELRSPLLKLLMETYFDIALALFLQMHFTFAVS